MAGPVKGRSATGRASSAELPDLETHEIDSDVPSVAPATDASAAPAAGHTTTEEKA